MVEIETAAIVLPMEAWFMTSSTPSRLERRLANAMVAVCQNAHLNQESKDKLIAAEPELRRQIRRDARLRPGMAPR